jgi:cell division protease FtsH
MADEAPTERRPRTPLPSRGDEPGQPTKPPPRRPGLLGRRFWGVVFVLLAINYLSVALFAPGKEQSVRIPYNPTFLRQVTQNNVRAISATGESVSGEFKNQITFPAGKDGTKAKNFDTEIPTFANTDQLSQTLQDHNVEISAEPINAGRGTVWNLLLSFGPVLLLVGLFIYLGRRAASAGGGLGGLGAFGRSRARRVEGGTTTVTFQDVAGIDEAKAELTEVVDFLRNPDRYRRLGGRIPRGVLLSGAPGTGKTLLARAVAGEAGVPFFSSSASEFVEAIVGIGASRVRDLFKQAAEAQPAIIFIDELDAIGRSRGGANALSGNDEREQTLNQILTEMDGFGTEATVIVLGATNRPEVLDPALLRPGRFDRRVTVPAPDKDGRRQILEVHTRSLPLGPDVDLDGLAAATAGMVGADLANLANEAALTAARRNHDTVTNGDFTDSLEKIVLGAPRGLVLSEAERRRTAYHEAGHAIVGMLTPGADPVRKVSIIPRAMSLGVTLSAPEEERTNFDVDYLRGRIKVALGGRGAEEVVYDSISAGAESDIQQLTRIARQMVGRWGMSSQIGPIAVLPSEANGPLLPGASEVSERTQQTVDEEVRRIVEEAHAEVLGLLSENRHRLDSLAEGLLERETLDEVEAYEMAGVEREHRQLGDAAGAFAATPPEQPTE